ncbi:hypothetical protein IWW37_003301 [Coemansia sp. RSA 2050]|nr:hypothetical protein IWW37_003301 [Coemansia sp. RSA 2050]KAJ2733331.1 hypothetical protein IW152_003167 [Coemansia sp. BCRC 34962]
MRVDWTVNLYDRYPRVADTVYERRMRQLSSAIRSKPGWMEALNSAEMRADWEFKAKAQGLTDVEFRYVLDELAYYSSLHLPGSNIRLGAADGVWFSDSLIDAKTTIELKGYAAILESGTRRPGGQHSVRHLIDPSLYPLVYGRSKLCLPGTPLQTEFPGSLCGWRKALNGSGNAGAFYFVPFPYERYSDHDSDEEVEDRYFDKYDEHASEEFSWLPSEFLVDNNGSVTIESYINNLHPVRHAAFYPTIASVFSKFLPLLEQVATDLVHPLPPRVIADVEKCYESDEPMPNKYSEDFEQWRGKAKFVHPQPGPFAAPERPANPYKLRGGRLQVIVKMTNVELMPENPIYGGEPWSMAGLDNERIIATGIFFYDVANIADSSLRFREAISGLKYGVMLRDADAICMLYGIDKESRSRGMRIPQEVDSVDIKDGLCLAFPNTYQFQMPGLGLKDATKAGHCKMLMFYLVEPTVRIPSTEIVPPQQKDWWIEDVLVYEPFSSLPELVVGGIMDKIEFPISLKEAEKSRSNMAREVSHLNALLSIEYFDPNLFVW